METERSDDGLTIKLKGLGSLGLFVQTLLRAKFYDDDRTECLLSPLLNGAISEALDALESIQSGATADYAGWVDYWHSARVRALVAATPVYLAASPVERIAMMRTALYPHEPN